MIPWPQTIMIVLSFGFLFATDVTVRKMDWDQIEMFPPEYNTEIIYFEKIEKVDGYYISVQDSSLFVTTKREDRITKRKIKKHPENLQN